jgi:hypothetical protein
LRQMKFTIVSGRRRLCECFLSIPEMPKLLVAKLVEEN